MTTTTTSYPEMIVTYQAPNGSTLDICDECNVARVDSWPRNSSGEYCTVSHGRRLGVCDLCGEHADGEY